jgi:tetratricopeptide (TPR) repeat protein
MIEMQVRKLPAYSGLRATVWRTIIRAGILVAGCSGAVLAAQTECQAPPSLQATMDDHPNAAAYAELGAWFGQHNQYDCANEAFRSALKLDPASAKVNYFLGLSLYSTGKVEAALGPLQESAQLDGNAIQPRLLLATALHGLGRRSDAETQWNAVLKIDPANKDALGGLSNSMMDGGDFMVAIDLLRNAKRDEDLDLDLARAYGLAGMLDEAAATVKDAMAADPTSLRLTNALATVYLHQLRFQDAAALLGAYLQQHPNEIESQVLYLRVLVLNNDFATARPLGSKLLASAPRDFDVLSLNGILEREAGDYPAARNHLQEAVKLQPEDYATRYNLGAALAHLNDAAGARQQLEKAIALDPSQAEAHFQLAAVLRTTGETQAAQEQLKTYQELQHAAAARSEAETKAKLAAQKLAAGDTEQAVALYREAVAATPDNALLNYHLAVALHQAGDAAGERAALEQAVKIDPTFALAQNQLGYLMTRSGDPGAAEAHFRQAVKSAPAFTDGWINLAATLALEKHFLEAQEAVANALRLEPTNAQALQLSQDLNAAAQR